MLYTKVLDEYKIDYEEYLREREVDFFGMKDRYLKYIQTKGIDHFTFTISRGTAIACCTIKQKTP